MADKITLSITPSSLVLTKDFSTINYVFSFYTPEKLQQFLDDLSYCQEQGWVVPTTEEDFNRPEGFIPGKSAVWLDTNTNTFYQYYVGGDLQSFLDYFVIQRKNLDPIKDYFAENPDKGTVNIRIE